MCLVKQLGGVATVPRFDSLPDLNLEMRYTELEDGSCRIEIRDRNPVN